mgnify:CR=1 FL=1
MCSKSVKDVLYFNDSHHNNTLNKRSGTRKCSYPSLATHCLRTQLEDKDHKYAYRELKQAINVLL